MVYSGLEGFLMMINAVFVKAVEKIASEQKKDLRELAHEVFQMSSPDVSIREFRRISQPDYKGRLRQLSFAEAYQFAEKLGKSLDEIIKIGLIL